MKTGAHQQAAGEGERVFDLEGGHVLPGLWNVHTHLGAIFLDPKHLTLRESALDRAIQAARQGLDC